MGKLQHIAIIMDGNGRWAQERGLPRLAGHERGAEVVRDIVTHARECGLPYLTLFSFSAQNWRRPPEEVAGLMRLLEDFCERELPTLLENGIRLRWMGRQDRLPPKTTETLLHTIEATRACKDMTLTLAVDYGAREELVAACRRLVESGVAAEDVSEERLADVLHCPWLPDPDLLIRTSGEERISNFMLWQIAYTELAFVEVPWPEFNRTHYEAATQEFQQRERRYGALSSAVEVPPC